MPDSSRRSLYRVAYPLTERPAFLVGRHTYEVLDCSEAALRYEVRDRRMPAIGTQIGGTIQFRRGAELEVAGDVMRASSGLVVLRLFPPGIPFGEVIAEQRYLRVKGYTLRD